jgi:hypothetical protein
MLTIDRINALCGMYGIEGVKPADFTSMSGARTNNGSRLSLTCCLDRLDKAAGINTTGGYKSCIPEIEMSLYNNPVGTRVRLHEEHRDQLRVENRRYFHLGKDKDKGYFKGPTSWRAEDERLAVVTYLKELRYTALAKVFEQGLHFE